MARARRRRVRGDVLRAQRLGGDGDGFAVGGSRSSPQTASGSARRRRRRRRRRAARGREAASGSAAKSGRARRRTRRSAVAARPAFRRRRREQRGCEAQCRLGRPARRRVRRRAPPTRPARARRPRRRARRAARAVPTPSSRGGRAAALREQRALAGGPPPARRRRRRGRGGRRSGARRPQRRVRRARARGLPAAARAAAGDLGARGAEKRHRHPGEGRRVGRRWRRLQQRRCVDARHVQRRRPAASSSAAASVAGASHRAGSARRSSSPARAAPACTCSCAAWRRHAADERRTSSAARAVSASHLRESWDGSARAGARSPPPPRAVRAGRAAPRAARSSVDQRAAPAPRRKVPAGRGRGGGWRRRCWRGGGGCRVRPLLGASARPRGGGERPIEVLVVEHVREERAPRAAFARVRAASGRSAGAQLWRRTRPSAGRGEPLAALARRRRVQPRAAAGRLPRWRRLRRPGAARQNSRRRRRAPARRQRGTPRGRGRGEAVITEISSTSMLRRCATVRCGRRKDGQAWRVSCGWSGAKRWRGARGSR